MKIYVLFNYDINEDILCTTDKQLAEEYMMDYFINDVLYQWYWEQQYNNHFDPVKAAKEIWEDMMSWYENYIEIFESEVIL